LWTRDIETNGVLDACRELKISFIPFSPLGRGFLTGKVPVTDALESGDFRHNLPRFQPGNVEANRRLVTVIEEIAAAKGATAAQVALAWVLAQGNDIIPIPGAKRIEHLEQNIGAVTLILTRDECTRLEATFTPENISGNRYPAAFEAMAQK
jgi:aryl-alcohol dehydrogenase-like predicted oxidoreductase